MNLNIELNVNKAQIVHEFEQEHEKLYLLMQQGQSQQGHTNKSFAS